MEGLAKNYDMRTLYYLDYANSTIVKIAIWIWRKEVKKLYPNCEITILPYDNHVRLIATEPEHCEGEV